MQDIYIPLVNKSNECLGKRNKINSIKNTYLQSKDAKYSLKNTCMILASLRVPLEIS